MSDDATTTDSQVKVEVKPQPDAPKAEDKPLGENGEKALRAERTRAAAAEKERDALKARLDKLEAANMSELERAQKQAEEAKAEVEKIPSVVASHLRDYLTELHDISPENRELYLTSDDPATLLKQAVGIASRTSTNPKPDLSQGAQHAAALNGDGLTQALERAVGRRA